MAVTPKGIVAPNASDPYNLVVDLNTLASTADTAMGGVDLGANRFSGTTAEMNAKTDAREGAIWYNTTDSSEYVRMGGVWNPSTGVVSPRNGVTFTFISLTRNFNGTATLVFRADRATSQSGVVIGVLPAAFYPSVVWSGIASTAAGTSGNQAFSLRMDPVSGEMLVLGNTANSVSTWGSITYPVVGL